MAVPRLMHRNIMGFYCNAPLNGGNHLRIQLVAAPQEGAMNSLASILFRPGDEEFVRRCSGWNARSDTLDDR